MSERTRRRNESFVLATPKFYSQPANALEVAFKDSDRRTTFERMCDSFKQTFLAGDEQHNFMEKNKAKLSVVLDKYRQRRIEYIDTETEVNNAPVNLDRQLPSAKLALYQLRTSKTPTPPWTALIPKETKQDNRESESGIVDSPAADDHLFPRMLKYLSFIGTPFMFHSPLRGVQDDAATGNAPGNIPMPTPGEVFGNPVFPSPLSGLRMFTSINVIPQATPARRSREEIVKEGAKPGNCTICLLEIEPGATVVYLGCGHCYHKECISRWLEEKSTCPVCREQSSMPT